LNTNAYIVIALESKNFILGKNFCAAAYEAFSIILRNPAGFGV
jgi:hypothetical protein